MRSGALSSFFRGVAAKRLSAVEVSRAVSHQHELNGVRALVDLLGTERQQLRASFVWLTDDPEQATSAEVAVTWYDSRERQLHRSAEFRLYYEDNRAIEMASAGDLIVVAITTDGRMAVILAPAGSITESQLIWLFGLELLPENQVFVPGDVEAPGPDRARLAAQQILAAVGIDAVRTDPGALDQLLAKFPAGLPSTREFSAFARSMVQDAGIERDPDRAVVAWMEEEESLFKTFERHLLADRVSRGFADVDEFIELAKSVQNSRKSRAGHALENHVDYIFRVHGIRFDRHAETEPGARPDFLFPGAREYHNREYPLHMLAAKSTCKDRWRQVLAEAELIPDKHLLTLEAGISVRQTDEMRRHRLTLVVPTDIQSTFEDSQRQKLMSVRSFVDLIATEQRGLASV